MQRPDAGSGGDHATCRNTGRGFTKRDPEISSSYSACARRAAVPTLAAHGRAAAGCSGGSLSYRAMREIGRARLDALREGVVFGVHVAVAKPVLLLLCKVGREVVGLHPNVVQRLPRPLRDDLTGTAQPSSPALRPRPCPGSAHAARLTLTDSCLWRLRALPASPWSPWSPRPSSRT